jgi:phosphate transport system substrate-binding protein
MKFNKTLLTTAVGFGLAAGASAQVELTITGSTAFRSVFYNRVAVLFDPGSLQSNVTNTDKQTYVGTISNAVPAFGGTQVAIRSSFSGSGTGMVAVKNQTPLAALEISGVAINKVADLSFSDVYPGAASPPIPASSFEARQVGVVPFVFVKSNAGMGGVASITRDQAILLMTATGDGGMPASYLGGASANAVYLIGRDSGSGTRITTEKVIGFFGSPTLWATNGLGQFVATNGYSSGSLVRTVVGNTPYTIGYLGLSDFLPIAGTATALSYNGVPFSPETVANGSYALWGYEHVVNRTGGLSANQALVRNALLSAISDASFQATNSVYTNSFVALSAMQVQRGADGGPISSLNF